MLDDWELIKLFKLVNREGHQTKNNRGQKKVHNKLHRLEHKLTKSMRERGIDVLEHIRVFK